MRSSSFLSLALFFAASFLALDLALLNRTFFIGRVPDDLPGTGSERFGIVLEITLPSPLHPYGALPIGGFSPGSAC